MELPLQRTWWIEADRVIGGQYPGTDKRLLRSCRLSPTANPYPRPGV